MATFIALPNELILWILCSCNTFSQVAALSMTCKRVHTLWKDKLPLIIWNVGRTSILAFNDALMAARATRIVLDHFDKPDPFPFNSLSGKSTKPSLAELKAVLEFEHLVKCIEVIFLERSEWDRTHIDLIEPDSEAAWLKWREGFRRSMYRVFVAGPALCRAYQEPLTYPDPDRPPHFLEGCALGASTVSNYRGVTLDETRYMLKYPVFNYEAYEQHEPIYGPLAGFLVHEAQEGASGGDDVLKLLPDDAEPCGQDEREANLLFVEVIQLLFAFLQFDGHRSDITYFGDNKQETDMKESLSAINIILSGRFFPEHINMPKDAERAGFSPYLMRTRIVWSTQGTPISEKLYSPFVGTLLDTTQCRSGQPNSHGDENFTPNPPLQLFQFICRKFLRLRFARDAFSDTSPCKVGMITQQADVFLQHPHSWPEVASEIFQTVQKDYTTCFE